MKIVLGDFNTKVERENIFKPSVGNGSLHQDGNDNGVRIINFTTSKNLVVISLSVHLDALLMGRLKTRLITC